MSQTVVEIPGLPPGVEVRRSTRRRRSVTAYREGGRTIVVVPQRMARADIPPYVTELVARLEARESRGRRSDAELMTRAGQLSRRYLDGRAVPASVRWVGNQRRRWGSCTPLDAAIRLSDRLAPMPAYVVDYVLLHELVHLLVPGHGPDFEAWMQRYPRLLEARAFLAGVDHATGHGLDQGDVDDVDDTDTEADTEADTDTEAEADTDTDTDGGQATEGTETTDVDLTDRRAAETEPPRPGSVPRPSAPRRTAPTGTDPLF